MSPTLMMLLSVLTARSTLVFSIFSNFGLALVRRPRAPSAPSCSRARSGGPARAARPPPPAACPGTDASTRERGCSSGIFWKSAGRLGRGERPGPVKSGRARTSARPRGSRRRPSGPTRNTSLSVLLTQSRDVPATGSYFGSPVEQDHLGRRRAHEHLAAPCSAASFLPGQRRLHFLPVVVGRELLEALRQLARRRPRALEVRGLEPASARCAGRRSSSARAGRGPSWC